MSSETVDRFRRWFWRPPRAHGDTIPDRRVSSLELFYDLVYVAVIGQAARTISPSTCPGAEPWSSPSSSR